jgi:hypothetical protein
MQVESGSPVDTGTIPATPRMSTIKRSRPFITTMAADGDALLLGIEAMPFRHAHAASQRTTTTMP